MELFDMQIRIWRLLGVNLMVESLTSHLYFSSFLISISFLLNQPLCLCTHKCVCACRIQIFRPFHLLIAQRGSNFTKQVTAIG